KEIGGEPEGLRADAREVALICVGALSAALARSELTPDAAQLEAAAGLREQAARLALRARATEADIALAPVPEDASPEAAALDEAALRGFSLGLRKVDQALRALGH